jgi:hypothetical protein
VEQTKRWSLFIGGIVLLLIALYGLFQLGKVAFHLPRR